MSENLKGKHVFIMQNARSKGLIELDNVNFTEENKIVVISYFKDKL